MLIPDSLRVRRAPVPSERDTKIISHKNNVTENDRNINSCRKIFIAYKSLRLT